MNKKFLYRKTFPLGILYDDEYDATAFWMIDDSQESLKKKLREIPICELIIELIDIFRAGNPNFSQLILLFGYNSQEGDCRKNFQGDRMIQRYNHIKRINKDIVSIEMTIEKTNDKSLRIREIYIFFNKLPPIETLKNKINETYNDVYYKESEGLMICENGCKIEILESI